MELPSNSALNLKPVVTPTTKDWPEDSHNASILNDGTSEPPSVYNKDITSFEMVVQQEVENKIPSKGRSRSDETINSVLNDSEHGLFTLRVKNRSKKNNVYNSIVRYFSDDPMTQKSNQKKRVVGPRQSKEVRLAELQQYLERLAKSSVEVSNRANDTNAILSTFDDYSSPEEAKEKFYESYSQLDTVLKNYLSDFFSARSKVHNFTLFDKNKFRSDFPVNMAISDAVNAASDFILNEPFQIFLDFHGSLSQIIVNPDLYSVLKVGDVATSSDDEALRTNENPKMTLNLTCHKLLTYYIIPIAKMKLALLLDDYYKKKKSNDSASNVHSLSLIYKAPLESCLDLLNYLDLQSVLYHEIKASNLYKLKNSMGYEHYGFYSSKSVELIYELFYLSTPDYWVHNHQEVFDKAENVIKDIALGGSVAVNSEKKICGLLIALEKLKAYYELEQILDALFESNIELKENSDYESIASVLARLTLCTISRFCGEELFLNMKRICLIFQEFKKFLQRAVSSGFLDEGVANELTVHSETIIELLGKHFKRCKFEYFNYLNNGEEVILEEQRRKKEAEAFLCTVKKDKAKKKNKKNVKENNSVDAPEGSSNDQTISVVQQTNPLVIKIMDWYANQKKSEISSIIRCLNSMLIGNQGSVSDVEYLEACYTACDLVYELVGVLINQSNKFDKAVEIVKVACDNNALVNRAKINKAFKSAVVFYCTTGITLPHILFEMRDITSKLVEAYEVVPNEENELLAACNQLLITKTSFCDKAEVMAEKMKEVKLIYNNRGEILKNMMGGKAYQGGITNENVNYAMTDDRKETRRLTDAELNKEISTFIAESSESANDIFEVVAILKELKVAEKAVNKKSKKKKKKKKVKFEGISHQSHAGTPDSFALPVKTPEQSTVNGTHYSDKSQAVLNTSQHMADSRAHLFEPLSAKKTLEVPMGPSLNNTTAADRQSIFLVNSSQLQPSESKLHVTRLLFTCLNEVYQESNEHTVFLTGSLARNIIFNECDDYRDIDIHCAFKSCFSLTEKITQSTQSEFKVKFNKVDGIALLEIPAFNQVNVYEKQPPFKKVVTIQINLIDEDIIGSYEFECKQPNALFPTANKVPVPCASILTELNNMCHCLQVQKNFITSVQDISQKKINYARMLFISNPEGEKEKWVGVLLRSLISYDRSLAFIGHIQKQKKSSNEISKMEALRCIQAELLRSIHQHKFYQEFKITLNTYVANGETINNQPPSKGKKNIDYREYCRQLLSYLDAG